MLAGIQVSYAVAKAFDEAAAGSGKGAKRPRSQEGDEPESAAKPSPASKGKGGLLEKKSPVSLAKAIKNEAELAGMREAHLRDAEAICDFLAWIEKEVQSSHFANDRYFCMKLAASRVMVVCVGPLSCSRKIPFTAAWNDGKAGP